jgi:hypothetical protein
MTNQHRGISPRDWMSSLSAATVPDQPTDPVLPGDENAWRDLVVPTVVLQVWALILQARVDTGSMGSLGGGRIAVSG